MAQKVTESQEACEELKELNLDSQGSMMAVADIATAKRKHESDEESLSKQRRKTEENTSSEPSASPVLIPSKKNANLVPRAYTPPDSELGEIEMEKERSESGEESDSDAPWKKIKSGSGDTSVMDDTLMTTQEFSNSVPQIDFKEWESKFPLWTNPNFRQYFHNLVEPIIDLANECIVTCWRANFRNPSVHEFWYYFISKKVPRQSWVGIWKVVNSERRGWPLQYTSKAMVQLDNMIFTSSLSPPQIMTTVIKSLDDTAVVGRDLNDVQIWQLEPINEGPEFYEEGISIEEGRDALAVVRQFFETCHFPADSEDLLTYIESTFFTRLTSLYYLENPAPCQGILSSKDRGRIIAAIKQYHYLRNKIQELHIRSIQMDADDDAVMVDHQQSRHSQTVALEIQLDRHKSALDLLFNPQMRILINTIGDEAAWEDDNVDSYDTILVMKTVRPADLKTVYYHLEKEMEAGEIGGIENIRIMTDLEAALKHCHVGSTVYVVSGNYSISGLGKLGDGGNLIGIKLGKMDVTITPSDDTGDVWMLITSQSVPTTLKNLSIVVDEDIDTTLSAAIFISSGSLNIERCTMRLNSKAMEVNESQSQPKKPTAIGQAENTSRSIVGCKFINFDLV